MDGNEELYDRRNDPYEWSNLANDPGHENILEEHRRWIPPAFARPVPGKEAFFFDPYEYTWINREDKSFIDGKE